MKHAGPATFARISALLDELRAHPVLREKRPGSFELKSRAFLHFHDDPEGIFADVRLTKDFVRFRVTSRAEQLELLERIEEHLFAVEARAAQKSRRPVRGKRRSSGRV